MALWKESKDGRPPRESNRLKNDLSDSVNDIKSGASSEIKNLVASRIWWRASRI
jgi:hypothetical protein